MNKVLRIYKPIGKTPLQMISEVREKYPEYKHEKIGFAGRLDPMAHGEMLFMIGDATKERSKYLGLDKEYIFQALFGFTTDTYDTLGLITKTHFPVNTQIINEEKIKQYVKNFPKTLIQAYPPYSSKEVNGKPLFMYSRENLLSTIEIPSQEIKIYKFDLLSTDSLSQERLRELLSEGIKAVKGDFRQEIILEKWNRTLFELREKKFITAKFKIKCSSGTYVRGLTHQMGQYFGTGAIALDILRSKVGEKLNNLIDISIQ